MNPVRPVTAAEEAQVARLYKEKAMTIEAIAAQLERSTATIKKILDRTGIPRRSRLPDRWVTCSDNEVVRMYAIDLMDSCEIALEFNVCPATVRNRLKKIGIQRRPTGTPGAKLRTGERGMHGLSSHPLYSIWNGMVQRCHTPTNKAWDDYGGNGVIVCDRWRNRPMGLVNFVADMGERPPGTTLDRIDPFGNYEPTNCRWATPGEQGQNKRGSKANLQRMAEEIEMWRERALIAEALLAGLSGRRGAARRLSAVQNHLGQPESGTLAEPLFEFDADSSPAEVPGGHQSAA